MSNLPPNQYFGKMVNAAFGAIGQHDTPAIVLTVELTHVAAGGEWRDIETTKRDIPFFLTENAKERSFQDLQKLGFNGDFDAPKFSDPDLAAGLELTVINETYNSKLQDKVSITKLKAGGRELKAVNADVKRSLAAQFKTLTSASARPSTPPPPRAAPPAAGAAPPPSRPADAAAANVDDGPPF